MTGSSTEFIRSTMTVKKLNRKLGIWNPHNGNIKTLHDGIQQQMLLIMTTNKCFDTLLYFLCRFYVVQLSAFFNAFNAKMDNVIIITKQSICTVTIIDVENRRGSE